MKITEAYENRVESKVNGMIKKFQEDWEAEKAKL